MVCSIEQTHHIPQLSDAAQKALTEAARKDGIDMADLLEQALERELQRRNRRRALIARHRRRTVFPVLEARIG